ncbi:hypothetical protein G6F35_019135 [Rhizopus arrhizus]|nr:hypothetical protein G6F35_019135 [Rhizopus arrhizus]
MEAVSDPFNAIDEEFAGEVNHCRGQEKQKQGEQHMNAAGRAETNWRDAAARPARAACMETVSAMEF